MVVVGNCKLDRVGTISKKKCFEGGGHTWEGAYRHRVWLGANVIIQEGPAGAMAMGNYITDGVRTISIHRGRVVRVHTGKGAHCDRDWLDAVVMRDGRATQGSYVAIVPGAIVMREEGARPNVL